MHTASTHHNPRVIQFKKDVDLREEMVSIGCHEAGIDIMLDKAQFYTLRLDDVPSAAANILKQALLSNGGDAVLHQDLYFSTDQVTDALLAATWRQYQAALNHLEAHPMAEARTLAAEIENTLRRYRDYPLEPIAAGHTTLEWGRKTYIMGIINVTPDSFSGDGLGTDVDAVVRQARAFVAAGTDILDIGGESTRPGSEPISAEVEMDRVLPAVESIARETDAPISIDTYKAEVAAAALDAGAHMVNDVWGLQMDPALPPLIAERGVPAIIMHNRSKPKNAAQEERLGGRYVGIEYENLMGDILRELRDSIAIATDAGIDPAHIIIDPGIGFGKTVEQNLTIVDELDQLRSLGRPILIGPSRKSFIGYTLDAAPDERLLGTAATVVLGIARGADIVRVHDVQVLRDVVRMTDAIVRRM